MHPGMYQFLTREKLEAELARKEQQGFIKKVSESSEWVNYLVIPEKANDQIRLCIDA